jgi:hypothetical protein
MAKFSRLHDLYSFPGFTPAATVRGVFGDPFAVVITLRRRRKKLAADCVAPAAAPSTIKRRGGFATSIAVDAESIWSSSFDASCAVGAKP